MDLSVFVPVVSSHYSTSVPTLDFGASRNENILQYCQNFWLGHSYWTVFRISPVLATVVRSLRNEDGNARILFQISFYHLSRDAG